MADQKLMALATQVLPLEQLESLAEALLDFQGPGGLEAWLLCSLFLARQAHRRSHGDRLACIPHEELRYTRAAQEWLAEGRYRFQPPKSKSRWRSFPLSRSPAGPLLLCNCF